MYSGNKKRDAKSIGPHTCEVCLRSICGGLALSLLVMTSGCGGSKSGTPSSSTPPPAGAQNIYAGTQSVSNVLAGGSPAAGGVWSLSFDDTSSYFSYKNIDSPLTLSPMIGYFANSNGLSSLSLNGGGKGSGGYAVEVPGRAALLRAGDISTLPIAAVATNACPSLAGSTTFQFITFSPPNNDNANLTVYAAYGNVKIATQGVNWTFSDLNMFQLDGTSLSPAAIPSGTCAYTQQGYVANVLPSTQTQMFPITAAIGPSGFFALDEGQYLWSSLRAIGNPVPSATSTWPLGLVGVPQPASQLDTGKVVAARYAGFEFAPLGNSILTHSTVPIPVTQPVVFGQTAGMGTLMTGGSFANDDIAGTAASDITIDLGTQDPKNNGLYKSVTVTIPDPTGSCLSRPYGGTGANGNPTCIFPGIAIAGNPENKFAIYVVADDKRTATFNLPETSVLEFLLYQQ